MWEPFGTAPRDGPAYWQTGPKTRGTFNILSDCIITLTLCVYTSLHLNIPEYGKSRWYHRSWQKATWVVVGILAPELVGLPILSPNVILTLYRSPTLLFATGSALAIWDMI